MRILCANSLKQLNALGLPQDFKESTNWALLA